MEISQEELHKLHNVLGDLRRDFVDLGTRVKHDVRAELESFLGRHTPHDVDSGHVPPQAVKAVCNPTSRENGYGTAAAEPKQPGPQYPSTGSKDGSEASDFTPQDGYVWRSARAQDELRQSDYAGRSSRSKPAPTPRPDAKEPRVHSDADYNSEGQDDFAFTSRLKRQTKDEAEAMNHSASGMTQTLSADANRRGSRGSNDMSGLAKAVSRGKFSTSLKVFRGYSEDDIGLSEQDGDCVQRALEPVVSSASFEYAICFLIISNAVIMGAQTEYLARHNGGEPPEVFGVIEMIFCVCYTSELTMRLAVYRCNFFFMPLWAWNMFDFFLVSLQLVELVLALIVGSSGTGGRFNFMRILRILRVVRIIRLLRVLRMISELRTIIVSIASSGKALFWTLMLLLLIIYIISVYITQVVVDYLRDRGADRGEDFILDSAQRQKLVYYYGSIPRTILSLYQAMSGGVDWDQLASPLIDEIHPGLGLILCMYIAFSVLALMNVVTGVFVESSMRSARQEQERYLVYHVGALFQKNGKDLNDKLTWKEFHDQLQQKEMQEVFKLVDIDVKEAKELFRLLDVDSSGEVDFDEFLHGAIRLSGAAKSIDLVTVMLESRQLQRMVTQNVDVIRNGLNAVHTDIESLRYFPQYKSNNAHGAQNHHRPSPGGKPAKPEALIENEVTIDADEYQAIGNADHAAAGDDTANGTSFMEI